MRTADVCIRDESGGGRVALLTSPSFVLAVATLALNDHVLKPAFGNWITGKLSDVAGLLAFALFWCAWLPRRRAIVLATTAAAWMIWKSPLADAPLAWWNAAAAGSALPLARVVDYGDWAALLVLPVAWRLTRPDHARDARSRVRAWRRVGALASAMAAIVTFGATSIPSPAYTYPEPPRWTVATDKVALLGALDGMSFEVSSHRSAGRRASATDLPELVTVRIGHTVRAMPVHVTLYLEPLGARGTRVTLRSLHSGYGRAPSRPDPLAVQRVFVDTVIAPLRSRFGPAAPIDPYGER
jgi:hypothetical protein